jgi:hypothetical protein
MYRVYYRLYGDAEHEREVAARYADHNNALLAAYAVSAVLRQIGYPFAVVETRYVEDGASEWREETARGNRECEFCSAEVERGETFYVKSDGAKACAYCYRTVLTVNHAPAVEVGHGEMQE